VAASHWEGGSPAERFAADYDSAFDDFVRHMRRQGFPISDRVLEGAHERATSRATELAKSRGLRSADFKALANAARSRALPRYGY
jgi:hypothetical protein